MISTRSRLLLGGLSALGSATADLHQIPARPTYTHYTNVRFAYVIDAPAFLKASPEADNSDGRVFTSRTPAIELRVYGGYSLPGSGDAPVSTMREDFAGALAEGRKVGRVRLAVRKTDFFVISWESRRTITYERTISLKEGGFATAILTYQASAQRQVAPILTHAMRSLKALTR